MAAETPTMRPLLRALLVATVIALVGAAPSSAILNGQADTEHTYAGILVMLDHGDRVPVCSGFLVSPTVFVTAAHCIDDLGGASTAYVSFDQTLTQSSTLLIGTPVPNPRYTGGTQHDIAVVVLDEATNVGYASLPDLGQLDSLSKQKGLQDRSLTVVGYGANVAVKGGFDYQLTRSFASSRLQNPRARTPAASTCRCRAIRARAWERSASATQVGRCSSETPTWPSGSAST